MLVLSRKKGESVTIAGGIFVHVVRTQSDKVVLGFIAPSHVRIVRTELDPPPDAEQLERIRANQGA